MANSETDAVRALRDAYKASGLNRILTVQKTEPKVGSYTKMLFEPNDFAVRSLEIWETMEGPYCRIHWLERIDPLLKQKLMTIPGTVVRSEITRVGVSLNGDLLAAAKGLARALSPNKGP